MKKNNWIDAIKRIRIPRKTREEKLRCDFAERWVNFDEAFFKNFISTLTQEDFITYPSYQQYIDFKSGAACNFPSISKAADNSIDIVIHILFVCFCISKFGIFVNFCGSI